jgi:predicted regulator of Ras-like GTPase activity (Roadblock/LC7/MglB family)
MTAPMRQEMSSEAQQFNWLLNQFATDTPGVVHAIAVSSDGLVVAVSHGLDRSSADRMAAIVSAFISLARGTSTVYDLGNTNKIVVDLDRGYVLVSSISSGAAMGVLAERTAKLGTVGYEMAVFANRTSAVLTPQLVEELKAAVER